MWHWTQKASNVYRKKPKHDEASELHVPLLDIHPEGKLQREIKDIIDELDIMINITRRQRELIKRFCKHVENILDPEGLWRHGSEDQSMARTGDDDDSEAGDETVPAPRARSKATATKSQSGTEHDDATVEAQKKKDAKRARRSDKIRRKNHIDWFRMQSQDLLCEVGDRIEELEGLRESAKSTAQSVSETWAT